MSTSVLTLLLVVSSFWLTSCECGSEPAESGATGRTRTSLLLNWFPEAEHGGFYAADVLGLYEASGLDVTIHAGRPDEPVIAQVGTGRMDFGVVNAAEVLTGRSQGVPVVAVMAPLQTNPRCILVEEEDGIESFDDLHDLTLAMNVREPFAQFLRSRLPLADVRVVPYPGNVAQLLVQERFVQQAFIFSEPFVAEQQGAEVSCLMVSELGFNPYSQLLITREELVREQPELVRAMARASIDGWTGYLADPGRTNARIHELNPEMSLETLAYGARAIDPLVRIDGVLVGSMRGDRWEMLRTQLVEAEVLDADAPPASEAFTDRFLSSE